MQRFVIVVMLVLFPFVCLGANTSKTPLSAEAQLMDSEHTHLLKIIENNADADAKNSITIAETLDFHTKYLIFLIVLSAVNTVLLFRSVFRKK